MITWDMAGHGLGVSGGSREAIAVANAGRHRIAFDPSMAGQTLVLDPALGPISIDKGIELRRTPVGDRYVVEEMRASGAVKYAAILASSTKGRPSLRSR